MESDDAPTEHDFNGSCPRGSNSLATRPAGRRGSGAAGGAAHTTVISVPMTVGRSRLSVSNALTPQAYMPGNCGTAFLYLARVNGNQTRATYGFQ